jgi:hypothetical protein
MKEVTGGLHTTALVVEADAPPKGAVKWGNVGRSTIRILVDPGSGPISAARTEHLKQERWLVRGMEVPVTIDPEKPDDFEVDWDAVPTIEERATANDPTLADPIGAQRKVIEAMKAAGMAGPDLTSLPEAIGGALAKEEEARKSATPDRFGEAMERAAQEPAPAGKARAVVLISTIRPRMVQTGHDGGGPSKRTTVGKCNAVLSVNVPGQASYAVYESKFNSPQGRGDALGAGLPALVSSGDPTEVEILWDELPSLESQIGQRVSDKLAAAEAGMKASGEMEGQMAEAIQRAAAGTPPPAASSPGAGMSGLSPEMKVMMAQNAKLALQSTKDPAMRKMLIDQYRLAGIELDEEGNVL